MAWRCSGSTNAALVNNLAANGLITTERVKRAMLRVSNSKNSFGKKRKREKKEKERHHLEHIFYFVCVKLIKFGLNLFCSCEKVDRAHFVPSSSSHIGSNSSSSSSSSSNPYADTPQPIGHSATISAPHMHAHAAETLLPYLKPGSAVLDVGSGSGYLTRVLAELVRPGGKVVGVEHVGPLVDMAVGNVLKEQAGEDEDEGSEGGSRGGKKLLESGQIKFIKGDGRRGCEAEAPFDAIHVGAAASELHGELVGQLKRPGRYVSAFSASEAGFKKRLFRL